MDEKLIKDAQYRKGLSIAFFNATNSAISMIQGMKFENSAEALKTVFLLRDSFLEEHKNYYATVIANVGSNYKADETIKKLELVKSKDELKTVWLSLSQDERQDGEIIKVAKKLKEKYEKS